MFITGSTVVFTWVLDKTATVYAEDYFDLQVQDPDGITTYSEGVNGAGWTDSYLAPAAETDGSIVGSITLSKPGLYNIILSNGGATNFTILHSQLVMVVDQDLTASKTVYLD